MKYFILILAAIAIIGCSNSNDKSDAYGNFETDETVLSAENAGKINDILVKEGDKVQKGQLLAVIDTVQLDFQRQQLLASMTAVSSKRQDVQVQVDVLNERKANLLRDKKRFEKMFAEGSATQKTVDDINGELEVIDKNIIATRTGLNTANTGLMSEIKPLSEQLKLVNDKIAKCKIFATLTGTVMTKYVQNSEFAVIGKPLFKLANTEDMYLKVYVSGDILPKVKLNQKVEVLIDKDYKTNEKLQGDVTWISDKAEFTPKIIQTKDERVNLVYAVKVFVKNDGKLKIGMPGEVNFR